MYTHMYKVTIKIKEAKNIFFIYVAFVNVFTHIY